jgi:uncharacterized repeat protein (TIGR01451 family)
MPSSNAIANGGTGSNYHFSDAHASQFREVQERFDAIQTSYQFAEKSEPAVPEILAGARPQTQAAPVFQTPRQSPANAAIASAPTPMAPTVNEVMSPPQQSHRTPAHFAAQMNQIRGTAPQDFSNQDQVRQEFENPQTAIAQRPNIQQTSAEASATASAYAQSNHYNPTRPGDTNAIAPSNSSAPSIDSMPVELNSESAKDFISKLNANRPNENVSSEIEATEFGEATQTASPARMRVPEDKNSDYDPNVRPVSNEEDANPEASIKLSAPAIEVETFGPQTVGTNKPATYKIIVTNSSDMTADRILVGVDLPPWVDIENVNLTGGEKEITDGSNQARLIWKVDKISGHGSQTITITAIPRKPATFDLGIEWTLAPRAGSASIVVTQPKLEMNIVGPDEVQYGEQALYHVTVKNPGTGAAENVVVMLPEALGGERATLGNIAPGSDKNFQVELLARTAGELDLMATAVADGDLEVSADRKLTVRRANLNIAIRGPSLKYAGGVGQYTVTISNNGDASANEIIAAMAFPTGVQYLGGIETIKLIEGGLRWPVGSLDPGQNHEYVINCQLDNSGDLQLEVGAQGKGDLQAASACVTKVETVADLVLSVHDPKGPLPTGQSAEYEIKIRNRGSRAAQGVHVVMQFSEGIEPKSAVGFEHRLVPGQVLFAPIPQIDPGQELSFKVDAEAFKSGTHVFRAQLTCEEADSREIAEGTTKFFGDEIHPPVQKTANSSSETDGSQDFSTEMRR